MAETDWKRAVAMGASTAVDHDDLKEIAPLKPKALVMLKMLDKWKNVKN